MNDRPYRFGDVVEWDIEGGTIRWFIICGEPGYYQGVHVASTGKRKRWEYEDGRVADLGVGSAVSIERGNPPRLLNE